jgi:SLT domain-containing protein
MLSVEQKVSFYENGFVVIRDIVPIEAANAARRLVNRGLGNLRSKAQTAAMIARAAGASIDAHGIERIQEATLQSMRADTDTRLLLALPRCRQRTSRG